MQTQRLFLLLFLATTISICSQTDSLSSFYPYQKGNILRYYYPSSNYKYITHFVTKDTVLPNGKNYAAVLAKYGNYPDEIDYYDSLYFRKDSITGNIYKFYQGVETLEDSIRSKTGDVFGNGILCTSIESDTLFGVISLKKLYNQKRLFRSPSYLIDSSYVIDITFQTINIVFGRAIRERKTMDTLRKTQTISTVEKLIYAKIGQLEFGSLFSPDVRDSLKSFYPLQIGNQWVYQHKMGINPNFETSRLKYRTVTKDTVINNKVFSVIKETNSDSPGVIQFLFRWDSVSGNLFQFLNGKESMVDSLSCTKGTKGSVYSTPKYTFKSESTMVFGKTVPARNVSTLLNIEYVYYRTAALGIGEVVFGDEYYLGNYQKGELIYAKIDGKEYGVHPQKKLIDSLRQYHPLQKNNKWIYRRNSVIFPNDYKSAYLTREILGDTVVNGKTYRNISEYYSKDQTTTMRFERFDSITGNYYNGLPFDEGNDHSLADSTLTNTLNSTFFSGKLIKLQQDTIFGLSVLTRHIQRLRLIDTQIINRYAFGFGLIKEERSFFESYYDSLVYARINGKEFGLNPLSVKNDHPSIPKTFSLAQNYPNPFNPQTTITYHIPEQSNVELTVFSPVGQEVAQLVNKEQSAGSYSIRFNGSSLASGIYFYKLRAGSFNRTGKMILLK